MTSDGAGSVIKVDELPSGENASTLKRSYPGAVVAGDLPVLQVAGSAEPALASSVGRAKACEARISVSTTASSPSSRGA
jgi:hypothetical protein